MPFRNSFVETVSATAQNLPNGRILGAMATGTWEGVAAEWARHVRSGGDAPFEWNFPAFCTLLPEPAELAIDCGCGEGRASRALRAQGHRVTGVDSSATLVRLARQADTDGDYRVGDVCELAFEDGSADLVVSFMVLQDVADHARAIAETSRVLRSGGVFCFAIVHPVMSAGQLDDAEELRLGTYCAEYECTRPLHGRSVTQYHRPLSSYMRALESAALVVETLREVPTKRKAPGRYPMFLHVRARKR
jgi:ubiquinone/menaquinone biosynthesis C-methylase UbiE